METGKISADFEDGLPAVTIPKTAKPTPVKIPIGAGELSKSSST